MQVEGGGGGGEIGHGQFGTFSGQLQTETPASTGGTTTPVHEPSLSEQQVRGSGYVLAVDPHAWKGALAYEPQEEPLALDSQQTLG